MKLCCLEVAWRKRHLLPGQDRSRLMRQSLKIRVRVTVPIHGKWRMPVVTPQLIGIPDPLVPIGPHWMFKRLRCHRCQLVLWVDDQCRGLVRFLVMLPSRKHLAPVIRRIPGRWRMLMDTLLLIGTLGHWDPMELQPESICLVLILFCPSWVLLKQLRAIEGRRLLNPDSSSTKQFHHHSRVLEV